MEEKYEFPTEEVTLPSKGLLYPEESGLRSGIIQMKYMTAKEEDILTNVNFIRNGTAIDKLLQAMIKSPINYNDLLVGDKNAILVAARILGYGNDYTFKAIHPETGVEEELNADLTTLKDIVLDETLIKDGKNEFEFTLPISKTKLTFKLLTHGDENNIEQELKGLKKINANATPELTTRLKHTILSVNGNYEQQTIRQFVDQRLLARDSRALRNYIKDISPDVDFKISYKFKDGYGDEDVLPIGVDFFWPDAEI